MAERAPPSRRAPEIPRPQAPRPALWWAPNALTLLRLALAPVVLGCLAAAWWTPRGNGSPVDAVAVWMTAAGAAFALAGLLDFADGRLARALGVESRFGEFWDPVADKVVIGAALLGLAVLFPILAPAAAVIVLRDAAMTRLRLSDGGGGARAPSGLAKLKTAIGFVGVGVTVLARAPALLLNGDPAATASRDVLHAAGVATIYVTAGLSMWTAAQYARAAARAASPSSTPKSENGLTGQ